MDIPITQFSLKYYIQIPDGPLSTRMHCIYQNSDKVYCYNF